MDIDQNADPLSAIVIGAAIEVHRHLGPGLLQSIYHKAIKHEFELRNVRFSPELPVPVHYKQKYLGDDLRLDFLVEDKLVIELKAVEKIHPIHEAQLITYLKLTRLHTGLLINFNVRLLKEGLKRIVL